MIRLVIALVAAQVIVAKVTDKLGRVKVMLVLSRKMGESILLDNNIAITVTNISGGRVRIGISAPRDVRIRRAGVSHGDNKANQEYKRWRKLLQQLTYSVDGGIE